MLGASLLNLCFLFAFTIKLVYAQDTLGLGNGYLTLKTKNFEARIVRDAQVLASLKPNGDSFDFLPFNQLSRRARNGQYHWGDITIRYRLSGGTTWTDVNSAVSRRLVTALTNTNDTLAISQMAPTLPSGPLNVTREWIDIDGDLGLRFTIQNTGTGTIEIGSLGFPTEFNSIFTDLQATEMQRLCSLADPYIGMHAGHIRVAPTSGSSPALVVTPLGGTPLEAYRNLVEQSYSDLGYGSQTVEGFYEWQVLSKAWAEKEWHGKEPWNPPSARMLQANQSLQFGVRFSVVRGGVRDIDAVVRSTGTPVAIGVPGYIIPRDLTAQLFLQAPSNVTSLTTSPAGAFSVAEISNGSYQLTPSSSAWGRVRLDIRYADNRTQAIHYYITKPAIEAVADLGRFLTTEQWYNDSSDPFGRAPSVMTYDYETKSIVTQDSRVWIAGLSDEGGAGSFLAAAMKQAVQPHAGEIAKLEEFVDRVLWGKIQTTDYSVRKSVFFYEPSAVPGFKYDTKLDWGSWTSWNRENAYATNRAYDYVHVAAAYWALYRAGRGYAGVLKMRDWEWYLNQAYQTVIRAMQPSVGYNRVGLMGETVFGEILLDLKREGRNSEADTLTALMRSRATQWDSEDMPFGSEMAWDSTGQEGVYYWTKYFGMTRTAAKTVNSVLGYMPTVPHWGWNGNARRYWDNVYGGKLRRIERQIHHYGSGLNSLVLLSAFRSDPSDLYLLRVGHGGNNGPLSNINQDGFAAASFHSWPDTLAWDGLSGDYGPGFVGLAFGAGTYVVKDKQYGWLAYGGYVIKLGNLVSVRPRDAVRRRVFIDYLGLLITVDAGVIDSFSFDTTFQMVSLRLARLPDAPEAEAAVIWLETTAGNTNYTVITPELNRSRLGWRMPLDSRNPVVVLVGPV